MSGISKSQVSRLCGEIDDKVKAFLARPIEGNWPYLWIIAERKRNEDASLIKYWKSTGVASKGGVISDREIQVWIDWLEKDGLFKPCQVKASDTYTNAFNYFRPGKTAEALLREEVQEAQRAQNRAVGARHVEREVKEVAHV